MRRFFKTNNNNIKKTPSMKVKSYLFHDGAFTPYGSSPFTRNNIASYYDKCAPLATAIDWIKDEVKGLTLQLNNGKESVVNKGLSEILRKPNTDKTQIEFMDSLCGNFLLSNEVYILGTGKGSTFEMSVIPSKYVTVNIAQDGLIGDMRVSVSGGMQSIFKRDAISYRFYSGNKNKELWQIKGFQQDPLNNDKSSSLLNSIEPEILQYIEANNHNLSGLKQGVLPSGIIEVPDEFDFNDEQRESLRAQISDYYAGGSNAKKVMILSEGMTWKPVQTKVDMDFEKLHEKISKAIFSRLKIPLELVTTDHAAAATAEHAMLSLYDNAVLPNADRLLLELTNFLQDRYNIKDNERLVVNVNETTALQVRKNEQIKIRSQTNIATINELRQESGLDDIVGGDVVLVPTNLHELGTPPVAPTTKDEFVKTMIDYKNKDGGLVYTKSQLEDIADQEGLI